MMRTLDYEDEPQNSGAVVAVHLGDYRRQEIWVRSGANIGNWYCLGGEFGRPKTVQDPRTGLDKIMNKTWEQPAGTLPLHPHWGDVLARGPVTLLHAGNDESYAAGWRAGRRALWQGMEDATYDDPPNSVRIAS